MEQTEKVRGVWRKKGRCKEHRRYAEAEAGTCLLQQRRMVKAGRSAQLGAGSTTEGFRSERTLAASEGECKGRGRDAVELADSEV
ncbi:hypothetical protein HBI56_201150 [Parastagonospora nodorum]|uniref:Uncharacterized protein n=1 Tax=Phaeosphaeria nodorum (strain SN15 / ATCC MYA-4574 / FGSC 10173) TaxID=321614 RepID=A0A7U2EXW0_PHANO|nr:hypothetical protein HBH56_215700 [Parastagonospora nodorum]QRC93873.1 hypothetical protein JI435_404690 [Parastagonospora nodorum SN15]KAH3922635.1 hypothetical protein HBH54_221810 [Parastagonospora nodorum]KAH3942133.1 hypothetical protein HBH53_191710 [Parastagonospora nodorum]KAH3961348.1 hypothetical protein HBH51_184380 [Parastagonospora nodorum]